MTACAALCCAIAALAGCKWRETAHRALPDLAGFDSCSELENRLKVNLKNEMRASLLLYDEAVIYAPPGGAEPRGPGDGAEGDSAFTTSNDRTEGEDYSGTNNQEAGVDEADIVKTDGHAIYVLNNNAFMVLEIPQFGRISQGASTPIEGDPVEMLIHKPAAGGMADTAIVFSSIYTYNLDEHHPVYPHVVIEPPPGSQDGTPAFRTWILTKLTIIDLTGPGVVKELYLEGQYQTARMIEDAVHLVAYSWLDMPGLKFWPELPDIYYTPIPPALRRLLWNVAVRQTLAENERAIDVLQLSDLVPRYYERSADSVSTHLITQASCENFSISLDGMSRGFTSLLSLALLDDAVLIEDDHIVSNWSTVYVSSGTMIIAEPAQAPWWYYWENGDPEESTNIHLFALDNGTARYTGSGRVAGSINNQFSLSEYRGAVRVAATTNAWTRWWAETPPEPQNHVYVLLTADNGSLYIAGQVKDIATGERIWAARFIEDKGYLVTFRTIDPLFTVDVSTPTAPQLIGEIEVPGVSTYIHPVAQNRLLTIGYGGTENGLDGSIKVSLFDVSDFADPGLIDTMALAAGQSDNGSSWASSEAVYEHKAFQYWEQKRLLAVPLSAWSSSWDGADTWTYTYISRLTILDVDKDTGFTEHGTIDHGGYYNKDNTLYWPNQDIRRSIFMGDYLYAISDRAITATRLDNMTETDAVPLPGTSLEYYTPYMEADR